ncbi:MAG: carboxypeptidase-like regulatory domain-containing protein, partial [Candidatus Baltobacteraceae bacterium]
MSVIMLRRALAAFALISLAASGLPIAANAQSDSGQITITVTDAATKGPIVLARVMLDGPVLSSEYSGTNGAVKFTEVPDGIYRARVFSRGYQAVTSDSFEIINGRAVTVSVSLAKAEQLTIIGSVTVHSSATISSSTLSDASAQRKLSDTLADALNKISGVSVSTSSSDSDATQTVSLEGHDASQT